MAKFTHPPFADKQCEVCHSPAKDGKVVLTQTDAKALCVTCHDDKAKLIETRQSSSIRARRVIAPTATARTPAGSRGFPRPTRSTSAWAATATSRTRPRKPFHHQPAFQQGCATCHQPHGGENDHLLRAKTTERTLPGVPWT